METYTLQITGKMPLIMHQDNIVYADALKTWRLVPENKRLSVAGDDRSPAHTWLGCLYHDGTVIAIPSDNLSRCFMESGASVLVPGGKSGKTFKSQTQSGMAFSEEFFPLLVDGATVPVKQFFELETERDFAKHIASANARGFELYVKRAKIGTSKHVRVRPRFHRWQFNATLVVWDDQITLDVLKDIARVAGDYKGLGDWRPSSRTPGPYGRFDVSISSAGSR